MNSSDLIWENKRAVEALRSALGDCLKNKVSGEFSVKEPTFEDNPSPREFHALGMLRLNAMRGTGVFLIGSTQPKFCETFHGLFSAGGAPIDVKAIETEVVKAVLAAITPELKANQIIVDPKSIFCLPQKVLGPWEKVAVQKVLRLPFCTAKGELFLEIPIVDAAFQAKQTQEKFGFSEDARVMVVDDSATTRKLSRHYLACAGFQNVEECVDGQAAFAKIASSRPPFDLVVADWHMPNMTGLELLKKVRGNPAIKDLPIILVTGERNKDEVSNAIKEGVSGYVVKPFEADMLYKAMKRAHGIWSAASEKSAGAPKKKAA